MLNIIELGLLMSDDDCGGGCDDYDDDGLIMN